MEARDAGAEAVGSLGKQGGVAMVTGRANQWQRYSLAASRTRHPGEGGGGKIHRCDPGGQEGTMVAKQVERCIFLGGGPNDTQGDEEAAKVQIKKVHKTHNSISDTRSRHNVRQTCIWV